ncbi:g4677 [Coccomyxa elongata]
MTLIKLLNITQLWTTQPVVVISKDTGDADIRVFNVAVRCSRLRDMIRVDGWGFANGPPANGGPEVLGKPFPEAVRTRAHLLLPEVPLLLTYMRLNPSTGCLPPVTQARPQSSTRKLSCARSSISGAPLINEDTQLCRPPWDRRSTASGTPTKN